MPKPTLAQVRSIFLDRHESVDLVTAAGLLGVSLAELERDIGGGGIVATTTGLGVRIGRAELMAAAMRRWEQAAIEEGLGGEVAEGLPEAIRLVGLRARVPRYQREVLRALARREGTTVDAVLARELEDVACAHAEELGAAVPGLAVGLVWPGGVEE
jgi:hypothetical protein